MARRDRARSFAWVLVAMAVGAAACSPGGDGRDATLADAREDALPEPRGQMAFALVSPGVGGGAGGTAAAAPVAMGGAEEATAARKIVRNVAMTLEVERLDAALERLRKDTTAAGGYVATESRRIVENGVRTAEVTCRVPVARLDDSVRGWRGLGREEAFALATDDVTEQYSDTEVSLRNQQKLEARLLDLLNRQTNRLGDLLEIEKEAARVRSEIETLEARKRLWDQQVALASVVVHLHEPRPSVAAAAGGPLHTLRNAFVLAADNFVETVAGTIAALGTIVPLLAAAAVALWIVRALWRRRRARQR